MQAPPVLTSRWSGCRIFPRRLRRPSIPARRVTLSKLAGDLVRLFWTDLGRHHPGIGSISLAPEIAAAWRHRISYRAVTTAAPGGGPAQALVPRADARSVMMKETPGPVEPRATRPGSRATVTPRP